MGTPAVTHLKMDPVANLAVKSKTDYVPRKCCITNRLLTSKDHASVQLNVGHVDQFGIFTGESTVYCISGACRRMGASDEGLNRLAVKTQEFAKKAQAALKEVNDKIKGSQY